MTDEVWKAIPGYEGQYEASTWGRVRSLDRRDRNGARRNGKILRPGPHINGYRNVTLAGKVYTVHRLVALVFIGPRPPGMEVNHIDLDRANNALTNLEYLTTSQNQRHGILNNPTNRRSKLTPAQVQAIRAAETGRWGERTQLAQQYQVSGNTIARILDGTNWSYI